ncbi:MAG: Asp-tRNA(Asn)/Glu-tRNA(Gln) amidotransferase subunit GatB [Candidatus Aenigmatarchaeota archaeon]
MVRIGLECHVQLATQSKLFCGCTNRFSSEPNTQTCCYCLGLPGSKPRLNEKAVDHAIKIAIALGCKIPNEMIFSRKTYFYPDMAKNFQITQYEMPLAAGGWLKTGKKKIVISRINIEEDPARLVHEENTCLVDYNRSGVPLCEIVTEPQLATPKEARKFLQRLSGILQYLDIYDPDAEGSMRVDANVSIGAVRVEIKNITGFRDVEKALAYEIIRQKNLIARGGKVLRETRGWDGAAGVTRPMREKEEEEEYGYIFEPDIPAVTLVGRIKKIRPTMPELADEKIKRYEKELGVARELAVSITSEPDLAAMFEKVIKTTDAKLAAKFFSGELKKTLNYNNLRIKQTKLEPWHISEMMNLLAKKKITERSCEMLVREMILSERPENLIRTSGVERIRDEAVLDPIVVKAITENPTAVVDYISGREEAFHFIVGQAMRKTNGRGDPDAIRRLVKKYLARQNK